MLLNPSISKAFNLNRTSYDLFSVHALYFPFASKLNEIKSKTKMIYKKKARGTSKICCNLKLGKLRMNPKNIFPTKYMHYAHNSNIYLYIFCI